MDHQAGRSWRPLVDTAVAAQLLYFGRPEWADWRRGVDYYPESELIWLEADTLIRQKSGGKKSLDDFVHSFHGAPGGASAVKTYVFEDVVAAMNAVVPIRLDRVLPRPRLEGDAARAAGRASRTADGSSSTRTSSRSCTKAAEETSKVYDFWYSLGIVIQGDGTSGDADDGIIRDVVPGMPAAAAGDRPGDAAGRGQRAPLLREGPQRRAPRRQVRQGSARAPRREPRHVQDVQGRLPRRARSSRTSSATPSKPDLVSAIGQAKAGAAPAKK